ncbi:MAG: hypothetical protein OEZ32_11800 [Nitrospinota bacterium]|nr:hypothetical protein [Nitrospinota bacterium]
MNRKQPQEWTRLGNVSPKRIFEARLQAHYASQIVAAFGAAYVARTEDMSHMGMTWGGGRRAFISGSASGARTLRLALDLDRFELYALEPGSEFIGVLDRFNLKGMTFPDASKWLRKTSAKFGFDPELIKIDFEGLLDHPLAGGGEFTYDGGEEDLVELGKYFSNAEYILRRVCSSTIDCSSTYVWSALLDINVMYAMEETVDKGYTLGMGLIPGDKYLAEPYFYVNRYPDLAADSLPEPPAPGAWRTRDWTGLTLAASQIVKFHTTQEQLQLVERFLKSSTSILQNL